VVAEVEEMGLKALSILLLSVNLIKVAFACGDQRRWTTCCGSCYGVANCHDAGGCVCTCNSGYGWFNTGRSGGGYFGWECKSCGGGGSDGGGQDGGGQDGGGAYEQCIANKCPSASGAPWPEGWGQDKEDDLNTINKNQAIKSAVGCVCSNCATHSTFQAWPHHEAACAAAGGGKSAPSSGATKTQSQQSWSLIISTTLAAVMFFTK